MAKKKEPVDPKAFAIELRGVVRHLKELLLIADENCICVDIGMTAFYCGQLRYEDDGYKLTGDVEVKKTNTY